MKLLALRCLTLLIACLHLSAFALDPFKVQEIKFEGLQRVEPATVINYLPIKVGDQVNEELVRSAIQSLYSSGLFSNISIRDENKVLIIRLEERPFIASITFSGNKEYETDELKKLVKEVGLAEARVYDKAIVARAEQEIKRLYLSRSKYGLKISTVSSPLERNRVNLKMEFDEGEVARIKQIRIFGNKKFSEADLIEQMSSRTPNWASWFTRSDRYAKEKLTADVEQIRNFYLTQGYFEFSVESNQVTISPDRQDVFLTIVVNEGGQFKFGDVTVVSALPEQTNNLQKLVSIQPGSLFNAQSLNKSIKDITDYLGDNGYALTQVNASPTVDYDKKTVSFQILADVGYKTYVRKIEITGNTRTRDSVIRREIRQLEASPYDAAKLKTSRDRIDRLGFFKDVLLDTNPVEGKPDQVDVIFTVTEKPTGTISFGVGYNSTDKFGITAGISQDNIFGSGNNLAFSINTSKSARAVSLSATDPYFTDSGISRSFDLYLKTDKQTENGASKVDIKTKGAAVRFGLPVSDSDTIYMGLGGEYTGLTTYTLSPQRYIDLNTLIGGSASYPVATLGWARDSRDSSIAPSKGTLQRFNTEAASGSEIAYAKIGYQYQTYKPLNKDYTLAFNVDTGYGVGLRGKDFPFFKNYYVGGIGSVRGYEGGALGPSELTGTTLDHVGGTKKLVLNTEFLFPMPGTGNNRTAKLFLFADAGYSWSEAEQVRLNDLRYSAGFGFSWLSPIGPLKFSFAYPYKNIATDKLQRFQFQIGTGF